MECVAAHLVRLLQRQAQVVLRQSAAFQLRQQLEDNAHAQLVKKSFHTSQDVKLDNRDA